jgi:hypothetical protein
MSPVAIILGIVIILLIYVLYKYFSKSSSSLGALMDLSTTSSSVPLITKDKVVNSTSARFSYGIWVYINTWDTNKTKNIFYRQNSTTTTKYDIRLYLDPNSPTLYCDFYTQQTTTSSGTTTSTPGTETVAITTNFPIQKWVYIIVSVDGKLVDTYVDGKLITSQELTALPSVSDTDIYVGTFKAYAAQFQRWTSPMDPQTAWKNYMSGNGGSALTKMFSSYGIDITFKKDDVEQNKFKLL